MPKCEAIGPFAAWTYSSAYGMSGDYTTRAGTMPAVPFTTVAGGH